jgi:hypothetical protein
VDVLRRVDDLGDVLGGEAALVVLKCADKDDGRGKDQERGRVCEERNDAEPGK